MCEAVSNQTVTMEKTMWTARKPTRSTGPSAGRFAHRSARLALVVLLLIGGLVQADKRSDAISRGSYLVELLGCGRCHTEGLLTGDQAMGPHLAGSRIGIAYTAYNEQLDLPGVVFPGNLTPDPKTGLGSWSRDEVIAALTRGISKGGHERLTVMPWINYGAVTAQDIEAIADYLKALNPVERAIPASVPPGVPSREEYVRFGTYRFTPHWHLGTENDPAAEASESRAEPESGNR